MVNRSFDSGRQHGGAGGSAMESETERASSVRTMMVAAWL
jgi:hypothetical protein